MFCGLERRENRETLAGVFCYICWWDFLGEKARDELREVDAGVPVHFVLVLSLCSKSIF